MAPESRAAHSNRNEADWSALGAPTAELHTDPHADEQGHDGVGIADIASRAAVQQCQQESGNEGEQADQHGNHNTQFLPGPMRAAE